MEQQYQQRVDVGSMQAAAGSLAAEIYSLTLQFPKYEAMVMTPLIRRLSLSVASNLAKAFSVAEKKDFMFFITYANASCNGIIALSAIAKDIGYITEDQADAIREKCSSLSAEITAAMRRRKARLHRFARHGKPQYI